MTVAGRHTQTLLVSDASPPEAWDCKRSEITGLAAGPLRRARSNFASGNALTL